MSFPKKKVLIIEDNADLQQIYKLRFNKAGFEVALCNNGLEGIVKAVQATPDVILLDIMMPQMSGYEVLEAIQNNSSIRLPIIVCSNLSQKEDIQKALDAGADLYLCKSDHSGTELVNKVIHFLQERGVIDVPVEVPAAPANSVMTPNSAPPPPSQPAVPVSDQPQAAPAAGPLPQHMQYRFDPNAR